MEPAYSLETATGTTLSEASMIAASNSSASQPHSFAIFDANPEQWNSPPIEKHLHKIKTRALVVHGKYDRKQRFTGAKFLADGLGNGRLVVFENSKHLPPLEEVERFNQVLADFLRKTK